MRILLAVDGSVSSDRATQLVSSVPCRPIWSSGSCPSSRPSATSWTCHGRRPGRPTACASRRSRKPTPGIATRRSRALRSSWRATTCGSRGSSSAAGLRGRSSPRRRPWTPTSSSSARVATACSRRWSSGRPRRTSSTTRRARCSSCALRRSGPIAFADDGSTTRPRRRVAASPPGRSSPAATSTCSPSRRPRCRSPSASYPASTTRSSPATAVGRRGAPRGRRRVEDVSAPPARGGSGRRPGRARG